MSDRGFAPDASLACPFVAFEDDRDGRSMRPDHRHRCFAELRPAPRATAHQEAFCLSAGFAACPTFVDWARREAARVRPTGEPAVAERPAIAEPSPAERDERRDWASPPPWNGGAAGAAAAAGVMHLDEAVPPGTAGAAEQVETAGSAPGIEAPSFLAGRATEPSRPTPPRGAEPSAASGSSPAPRGHPGYMPADLDDELEADVGDDEGWGEPERDEPPMRRFGPAAGRSRYDDKHTAATPPRRRPPLDPDAPSWEKPRRYEAYPTLRTRTGLAGVSPLLAAGILIVLAAVALFFIPSFLLGLGGDGNATPNPSGGAAASASGDTSPSPSPAPTPVIYTVKSGDTLSGIAKQFGVTLDDLIAANAATLPDPDKLDVGDKLVIPIGGLQPSPSPSPVEASPSP